MGILCLSELIPGLSGWYFWGASGGCDVAAVVVAVVDKEGLNVGFVVGVVFWYFLRPGMNRDHIRITIRLAKA